MRSLRGRGPHLHTAPRVGTGELGRLLLAASVSPWVPHALLAAVRSIATSMLNHVSVLSENVYPVWFFKTQEDVLSLLYACVCARAHTHIHVHLCCRLFNTRYTGLTGVLGTILKPFIESAH